MFLNAIMLTGLAGAAVPLILHLLARARHKSIDWGAMMFLADSQHKQRQSTRLKQWILLAMRMAIVGLLASAMARPVLSGMFSSLGATGHVDAVLIIDCSASTAVEENGKQRIELARRCAVGIISQLQRGDRVALLPAGNGDPPRELSSDLQSVAQAAALLTPGDGKADVAAALARAGELLGSSEHLNREIYLVLDRQALNWANVDEPFARSFARRFAGAAPLKIFFVPVGGEETRNVAIESFTAQGLPAVARQPIELEIRLHNFGDELISDIPLTITDGQKELYRTTVAIPEGASHVQRTMVQFDSPGRPVLGAQIRPDLLPFDDRRELALQVIKPLEVLVISGDEREGLFRKESDFLRLALAPFATSGEQGADPTTLTILSPSQWQRPDPRKFPVIILANVPSLSPAQASDLEQYVYSGGGLIISAGNLVQSDSYNALLFRDGAGIMPASLGDSMSSKATSSLGVIGVDLTHPMFRFLRGRPDPVPSATIARHVPVQTSRSDARTLITLANGEPLLLERPAGRGKVLLFTSTLDADWNTLPLSGFYLPLMQSMVRYLAAAQVPELNVRQGEPLVLNVDAIAEDAPPRIKRPDGKEEPVELRPSVLSTELRYANTNRCGRYELSVKSANEQKHWTFVVQPPSEESNLASYTSAQLSEWRAQLNMQVLDARADALAAIGRNRAGRELWLPLVLTALALMATESWFSKYCSSAPS